jgi:hypothetical protein
MTDDTMPALPVAVAYGVRDRSSGKLWFLYVNRDAAEGACTDTSLTPEPLVTLAACEAYARALAAARGQEDAARLDWIASEYLTVEPFDMPTGQGDADVGWRVFQYHGRERKLIAEHHVDNVRAAIDAARQQEEDALVPLDTTAGVDRG